LELKSSFTLLLVNALLVSKQRLPAGRVSALKPKI